MSTKGQQALQVLASSIKAVVLDDNKTHEYRMEIRSSSSSRLYIVARSKSNGQWGCSCPGWIHHRNCKHLKAIAPALSAIDKQDKLLAAQA